MRDLSLNPPELTIDSETGIFTLENDVSKRVYDVEIIINNFDNCGNQFEHTVNYTITTVCGLDSTTLTPPDMPPICEAPEDMSQIQIDRL